MKNCDWVGIRDIEVPWNKLFSLSAEVVSLGTVAIIDTNQRRVLGIIL